MAVSQPKASKIRHSAIHFLDGVQRALRSHTALEVFACVPCASCAVLCVLVRVPRDVAGSSSRRNVIYMTRFCACVLFAVPGCRAVCSQMFTLRYGNRLKVSVST